MEYADTPQFLQDYVKSLRRLGRSERTIQGYYIDLYGFLKYIYAKKNNIDYKSLDKDCQKNVNIENMSLDTMRSVTKLDILEYLDYMMDLNQNKTLARKISSIHSLFQYFVRELSFEIDPSASIKAPKFDKKQPIILTTDQSKQLLKAIDGDQAPRDYCIILLFLNCAMRLSELVGINYGDIQENRLKLMGKGRKERYVFLNPSCLEALAQYEEHKRNLIATHKLKIKDRDALFLSSRGTRLTARRVEQIVKETMEKANLNVPHFSVHKLRHTAATEMFRQGVDIRILKDVLGHANVSTTEIYTRVENEQVREAIAASPLANFSRTFEAVTEESKPKTEEKTAPKKRGRPRKNPLPDDRQ